MQLMLYSALLTDFYQITTAYAYFKSGIVEEEACFHLTFRKHPFGGNYTLACGLEQAAAYIAHFSFTEDELSYLSKLQGIDNKPHFTADFIDYLRELKITCDIDAVEEGTLVFPNEPLVRVKGPIIQCQLLETPLLNIVNFQSLIATKSARICAAAGTSKVVEFGLRRAQGFDGGTSASRAAYVGGCAATSNVFAGKEFNIPVVGTLAHSWVMRFGDEKKAFLAYAKAMPSNCVLLVDTYNSITGVKNAIEIGTWLHDSGHELQGIRLDSGDMANLSKQARTLLNDAGFHNTLIVASNDLDEYRILALKKANAPIDVFGVGTRLVTGYDEPALGGVYKLAAIRTHNGKWEYRMKFSDSPDKITLPGILQTRRYVKEGKFSHDVIYDESSTPESNDAFEDLLVPIFKHGKLCYSFPDLNHIKNRVKIQLNMIDFADYKIAIDPALLARQCVMRADI